MQKQKDGTWRPITYASRALSPVERRYSPLERECLAVKALERFRIYLYGLYFTIKTDHKPLVPIFSSPMKAITPRIENLVIKAMPYNFKILYQPGKFNGADYLSRSNHDKNITVKRNVTEDFVNYVYERMLPQSISAETIAHEQHNWIQTSKPLFTLSPPTRWHQAHPTSPCDTVSQLSMILSCSMTESSYHHH